MHWISRHILKRLAFEDTLRYTELKPASVEGNLFQYHARLLEQRGLILRTDEGYQLTPAGKVFVGDLSQSKLMNPRKLPRPVVMIICQNTDGGYLLFRWRRQPYRGRVSFPFGRQTYGQTAQSMAIEQLLFKTGYLADPVYLGHIDVIHELGDDVIDHLTASIFTANNVHQTAKPDGLTGEYFWSNPHSIPEAETVAGFREILSWYEQPERPTTLDIHITTSDRMI